MYKTKKILSIVLTICALSLLLVGTFAWIPRSWKPEIIYPDMEISSSGALVVSYIDPNNVEYPGEQRVDLNKYMNLHSFSLKQVSSFDGKTFKSVDFTPIIQEGGVPIYSNDVKNKYIETSFWIKTQGSQDSTNNKKIFLDPESKINLKTATGGDASMALRVSIQVDDNKPIILCKSRDVGEIQALMAAGYQVIDDTGKGKPVFTSYTPETPFNNLILDDTILEKQQCFDITKYTTENNNLFVMDSNGKKKITIRVWLEGCDPHCVNSIEGSEIQMILKFAQA